MHNRWDIPIPTFHMGINDHTRHNDLVLSFEHDFIALCSPFSNVRGTFIIYFYLFLYK